MNLMQIIVADCCITTKLKESGSKHRTQYLAKEQKNLKLNFAQHVLLPMNQKYTLFLDLFLRNALKCEINGWQTKIIPLT